MFIKSKTDWKNQIDWRGLCAPVLTTKGLTWRPLLRVEGEPENEEGQKNPPPASDGEVIENPAAFLKAFEETKKQNKHLKSRLAGMEQKLATQETALAEIDPAKYKEMQQKAAEAEALEQEISKRQAALKADYDEHVASLQKKYAAEIDQEKKTNLETIKSFLLTQEYVKHGRPELAQLFLSGYGKQFDLEFDGDRPSINNTRLVALDSKGKPQYHKKADSLEPVKMDLQGWLEANKENTAISVFMPAPQSRGTGTSSASSGNGYRPSAPPKNANEAFAGLPTFAQN